MFDCTISFNKLEEALECLKTVDSMSPYFDILLILLLLFIIL